MSSGQSQRQRNLLCTAQKGWSFGTEIVAVYLQGLGVMAGHED